MILFLFRLFSLFILRRIGLRDGFVVGSSMEDTFHDGDKFFVEKIEGTPKPGTPVRIIANSGWKDDYGNRVRFIVKTIDKVNVSANRCFYYDVIVLPSNFSYFF